MVAASIVAVATFVASRRRVTASSLFSMVAGVTGIAMLAGGLAVVAAPLQAEGEGEGPGKGVVVALAAPEGAAATGFSTDALEVPSDEPFTLAFDNQDPAVPHNVVIFDGADADTPALFTGELLTGPAKADYAVEALPEGDHLFHCEVHPETMTGTMTASPGGGGEGGGGGGGPTVVAADLAFDTDTIELPPDVETTITLDNKDAGTPHDIAIYTDDSLGEVLFTGDLVTGPATAEYVIPPLPAGEYYFQCDVHPTMNGTVVVGGEGGGGSGGGGGPGGGEGDGGGGGPSEGSAAASIVAEGTAFDPTALSWAADTEVTLTFDNRDDAAVAGPHNMSIYDGESALFTGDLVSGPATVDYTIPPMSAGTYEFRCDVHPTMIGTVEVT